MVRLAVHQERCQREHAWFEQDTGTQWVLWYPDLKYHLVMAQHGGATVRV